MAAMNTNTSSKYEDIISKCDEISLGPPAVYQLRTKTENIGHVKKCTFGEKNPDKTNKTILLLGETGAGKSTLINALLNYSMGVEWKDEVWFQIIEGETKDQPESQTLDVTIYEIFGFEDKTLPHSLTIIDTPGYGSTRGFEHDDSISESLLELFQSEHGVHELHAVGWVLKATDNRLSNRLIYVIDSIMSLFGKDLENNIVLLITNSNGRIPKNTLKAVKGANVKCAEGENKELLYFLFDNCQDEKRAEESEGLENAHILSQRELTKFITFLKQATPQTLTMTADVLDERTILKACIQNLNERIKNTELKEREFKQIHVALKKNQDKMKMNAEFTFEVDEVYKEKQPIDGGRWFNFYKTATCCTVCQENCHQPCTVAWSPRICKVMKWGRCTVCSGKCPASVHEKDKSIYVTITKKVEKTLEDVKTRYERSQLKYGDKLDLLNMVEKDVEKLTKEWSQLLDEAYQHILKLEQFALKADSLFIHAHLDLLIKKMEEKGDMEKVQKLEEMRKEDKLTKQGVCYISQFKNE